MIKNVIFDLGGVLIDWNPRYMYSQIFKTSEAMEYFLANICTSDWNEEQDGGRPIRDANELLIAEYPEYEKEIKAFYGRWTEMLGGPIDGTVEILRKLNKNNNHRLLALTNWSAETWPEATSRYDFLNIFEGILVSGQEGIKKPDPAIYDLICKRYDMAPTESVFIDDNLRNIEAAQLYGLQTIHYTSHELLAERLKEINVL